MAAKETESTQKDQSPELRGLSAQLQEDGSILLADQKLWLSPAQEGDKAFILSTWVRSYLAISRKLSHNYKSHELHVKDGTFLRHHPRIAEALWADAFILRAEEGGAILGYVVGSDNADYGPILDYVYLVPELRNMGVARAMIEAVVGPGPTLTHVWPYRWHGNWKYDPYLAMRK